MKAICVHRFGGLEALQFEDAPRPVPRTGQVLVRVKAAGVGPWDAWVREGRSALHQPLPLIPGADLSGFVEAIGPGVTAFRPGDAVFGVTNPQFTGAYAEYAVADAARIAHKPPCLSHIEAASVPVAAVTAWQMLYDHGDIEHRKRVLIQGGGGNVGAYAVQFARRAGATVTATSFMRDVEAVRALGADDVIDVRTDRFEERVRDIDLVIDTIGGETLTRSFAVLPPGGILVSVVAPPDPGEAARRGVRAAYFIVEVTTECLSRIAEELETGHLQTRVGEVLPLSEARLAHEMLAGSPHEPGKIVLAVDSRAY